MTSGSDTQDAAQEATNIGGIAVYDDNCRYSGTPVAVLHGFVRDDAATLATARSDDTFTTSDLGATGAANVGLGAVIRTVSGTEDLSEIAHGADFTGDGIRDDAIPTRGVRVGFFGGAVPAAADLAEVSNIALSSDDWNNLNLDTEAAGHATADFTNNNNRVQIFVNRASDCWGIRRV